MPKILFLADSLEIGGTERQLTLLVQHLPASWSRRVVAFGGGMFVPILRRLGADLIVFERRSRFDLKPVWRLWKLIQNYRPDVVHSWSWMSSAIVAPMCKLLGIKFINGCIRGAEPITRQIMRTRIAFSLSDRIIANSDAGLKACGLSSAKAKVIYNGLDFQRFIQDRHSRRHATSPITVVMAARMVPAKNFMMLIDAAREISRIDPGNWKFVALGDGGDKERLATEAADLISSGVMEFPGVFDEVTPFLMQADIGVLLNGRGAREGLSNTIMEYMACGLPVICQNRGGNRELVIDGETGLVLESDNLDDFVRSLLWMAKNPEEARRIGECGKKRIEQLCSLQKMVAEFVGVYEDVLNLKKKDVPAMTEELMAVSQDNSK